MFPFIEEVLLFWQINPFYGRLNNIVTSSSLVIVFFLLSFLSPKLKRSKIKWSYSSYGLLQHRSKKCKYSGKWKVFIMTYRENKQKDHIQ